MVKVTKQNSTKSRLKFGPKSKVSPATLSANPVIVRTRDQLVPDNLTTTLLYADQFTITSGAGTYIQQQFKVNSAYDPDYTNAGSQPSGYDQLAAFYGFYKVFKAEFEIVFTAPAAYTKWMVGCMYLSPSVTIATTFGAQAAQPHGKYCFFSLYKEGKMSIKIDIAKSLGVDSAEFADVVYGADIGSNPTRLLYLTCVLMNADNSVGSNCQISFVLKQHVQFQQRTYLGLSLRDPKMIPFPVKQKTLNDLASLKVSKQETDSNAKALGGDEFHPSGQVPSVKPKRTAKQILAEFDLVD